MASIQGFKISSDDIIYGMRKTRSAGGVVVNQKGKVLMVDQKGTSWSLPKGHIEEGETELEAAKREIYEESGVKELKLIKKLGSYKRFRIPDDGKGEDKTEQKTITMFLFTTTINDLKPIDKNNPQAIWIDKKQVAKKLTRPEDGNFFKSIIDEVVPDKVY